VDLVGVQDVPAEGGDDRLDQPGFGVGLPDALAGPPVAVEAFHALLEGVEQVLHGFLPVKAQLGRGHELPAWAIRPSRSSLLDPVNVREHQITIWCSGVQCLLYSVNDAVNVLSCSTWSYLNGWLF
jgi:hypothetical protein